MYCVCVCVSHKESHRIPITFLFTEVKNKIKNEIVWCVCIRIRFIWQVATKVVCDSQFEFKFRYLRKLYGI